MYAGATLNVTHLPQNTSAGTVAVPSESIFSTSQDEELISDTVGFRKQANPVIHKKCSYESFIPSLPFFGIQTSAPWGWDEYSGLPSDYWNVQAKGIHPNLNWNIYSGLSSDALPPGVSLQSDALNDQVVYNELYDRCRNVQADIITSLLDKPTQLPKQMKSLLSALPRIKAHKDFIVRMYKLRRTGLPYLKFAKAIANAHLAWKFGIAPLLQDSANVVHYCKLSKDAIDRLYRPVVRVSKRVPIRTTFSMNDLTGGNINGYDVYGWKFQHTPVDTNVATYVMRCVTKKSLMSESAYAGLARVVHSFSAGPAETAWELVPYSFVVDWFVDVRNALRAVDGVLGVKPFTRIECTRSVKWSGRTDAFVYRGESRNGAIRVNSKLRSYQYKLYQRAVVRPGLIPVPIRRFGKSQLALTASLITQKLGARRVR
jgi:hypothetical protein